MKTSTIIKSVGWFFSAILIHLLISSSLFAQDNGSETYRAFLSGANEVSPVFTTGSGIINFELTGDQLTVTGSFEGLVAPIQPVGGTGVHLHSGFTGQNGSVEIPLDPQLGTGNTEGTFSQTVTLSSEQIQLLQNRQLYLNIHSERYPAGELRGQLLPANKTYFQAYASGGYEVPSTISTAQGGLSLEWDGSDLVVTGSFNDLTSDYIEVGETGSGAHLHVGFAGENGPVEISLTPTLSEDGRSGNFEAANNTFTDVPANIVETLANRGHYLNIHSTDYPAGEIRGQVVPEANIYFYAPLSGMNEIPQNASQATGAVLVEWYAADSQINASGSFNGLESDYNTNVGSHLHVGLAGQNGGVEISLSPELSSDLRGGNFLPGSNEFVLSGDQVGLLVSRSLYVNIHTEELGGGEIRGQVTPLAQHFFTTSLTGLTEVDPIVTDAAGGLAFEFRNGEITATGSFAGLGSNYIGAPGSHIHDGIAGANSGVIYSLTPELDDAEDARAGTYSANDNTFEFSQDEIVKLVTGGLYINVHSEGNPGGEIRGQVLLAPNVAPETSPEITFPADEASIVVEGSSDQPFEPKWTASEDANGDLVVYLWQIALDADFENVVFSASAGDDPLLSLTFGTVDGLLADLGVNEGESAQIWHRAVATDGSGNNVGIGSTVTLERGVVTSTETETELAERIELNQNYPNPFNPSTTISYSLPSQSDVTLKVYDMLGREVAVLVNRQQAAGNYTTSFDASSFSSGMYIYRLEAGSTVMTRKMMLVK